MGGVSALMGIGLFSVTGTESDTPCYEITSPIFDRVTIRLNPYYYTGKEFVITTHDNSSENCYIRRAELNGEAWDYAQFDHETFSRRLPRAVARKRTHQRVGKTQIFEF